MPIPGTEPFGPATLPQALVATARRKPDGVFLQVVDPRAPGAPPQAITFAGFERLVRRAAAFLGQERVGPGERVLILSENSPGWQAFALGAQALRAEPAALFAQLGAEQAASLALRVRPRVVIASTAAQWAKLAPVAARLAEAGLSAVVTEEAVDPSSLPVGVQRSCAEQILRADAAPELSAGDLEQLVRLQGGEDPFMLLFTSGTTGRPKGVRLPQRAMMRAIEGGRASTGCREGDVGLHFLPFAHVAGHDQFMLALAQGHGLVMVSRREDLARGLALGPTYLFSVPLVYERIRDEVRARLARVPAPLRPLARLLAGRAVRRRLGGRVRALYAGGAATPPGLAEFFEGLGLPFVELYGMSETAGLISSNLLHGARTPGSAGHLSSHLEARVADDGELCVRGGTLMTGYLDPVDEEGAFTPDGFFRTGDLARLAPDGTLEVQGRKKSLLVLSTGKKVSPEPIEQAIVAVAPFAGAVLLGEGRPFVAVAVFVPRPELERLGAAHADLPAELLRRVRAALETLSDYEKPKRLLVVPGSPEEIPGLLTPTLKLRRDAFLGRMREEVELLYAGAASRSAAS
jgi:long-chain acyl-CoA synthetase